MKIDTYLNQNTNNRRAYLLSEEISLPQMFYLNQYAP